MFKKACEIAQAMEMVDKNASTLKSEETKPSINVLKKPPGESKKNPIAKDSSQVKEIATAVEDRILHLAHFKTENAENVAKLVTSRGNAIPRIPSKKR